MLADWSASSIQRTLRTAFCFVAVHKSMACAPPQRSAIFSSSECLPAARFRQYRRLKRLRIGSHAVSVLFFLSDHLDSKTLTLAIVTVDWYHRIRIPLIAAGAGLITQNPLTLSLLRRQFVQVRVLSLRYGHKHKCFP